MPDKAQQLDNLLKTLAQQITDHVSDRTVRDTTLQKMRDRVDKWTRDVQEIEKVTDPASRGRVRDGLNQGLEDDIRQMTVDAIHLHPKPTRDQGLSAALKARAKMKAKARERDKDHGR